MRIQLWLSHFMLRMKLYEVHTGRVKGDKIKEYKPLQLQNCKLFVVVVALEVITDFSPCAMSRNFCRNWAAATGSIRDY